MWWIFDGLQKGSCTIKVLHDGDKIDFVPTKARKMKVEPVVEQPVVEKISYEKLKEMVPDTPEPKNIEEAPIEETPMNFKAIGNPAESPVEATAEEVSEEPKPTVDVNTKLKPRRRTKK